MDTNLLLIQITMFIGTVLFFIPIYMFIRTITVYRFRRSLLEKDYAEYKKLPSFDSMANDYFNWDFSKYIKNNRKERGLEC